VVSLIIATLHYGKMRFKINPNTPNKKGIEIKPITKILTLSLVIIAVLNRLLKMKITHTQVNNPTMFASDIITTSSYAKFIAQDY
jgi:hypothetical protein